MVASSLADSLADWQAERLGGRRREILPSLTRAVRRRNDRSPLQGQGLTALTHSAREDTRLKVRRLHHVTTAIRYKD